MAWTPRGADPDTHHTLVDGIPSHMHGAVRAWFVNEVQYTKNITTYYRIARLRDYDLVARPRVSFGEELSRLGGANLFDAIADDDRLSVIDWLIYDNATDEDGDQRNRGLERILSLGSSMWKVGSRDGSSGLERRVPEGVQDAAEAAMARPGDAGRLLSEAWHAVYGLNPQPDLGYRKSIEAVEALVLPLVMKNDDTATLGKAIGQMRAQGDWKLPFINEHKENPSEVVVLSMMQALWSGHSDRHPGTASYVLSTEEAAEAAVSLAVTLVNLFSSGTVARRKPEPS